MSLIHWWPLNGDLKDYGVRSPSSGSSGGTVNNSGKIGKCYENNSSAYTFLPYTCDTTGDFSVAFWIKIPTSMSGNSDWEQTFRFDAVVDNDTSSVCCFNWTDYQNFKIPDTARHEYWWLAPGRDFYYDVWFHVAVIFKEENGGNRTRLYINGVQYGSDGTSNYILRLRSGNIYLGNGITVGSVYYNDVRIYDHALSAKEVKEISKGLVLHYNFEDAYAEGTTNLANQVDVGGWNNVGTATWNNPDLTIPNKPCLESKVISLYKNDNGNSCITFGSSGNTTLRGQIVTASTWVYLTGDQDGDVVYLRSGSADGVICYLSYNGSTNPSQWPKEQWIHISGTGTVESDETYVYFCTYLNIAGEKRAFNGWQLEQKDHATPYVNGTRPNGLIYDNSGYGYNGTQVDCSIIEPSDNKSGKYSLRTNTSGYVQLPNIYLDTTFTFSTWCKHLDSFSTWARIFDFGNATTGQDYDIGFATSDTSGSMYVFGRTGSGGNLPDSYIGVVDFDWHLWSLVVNGTNIKLYKDGALFNEFTAYANVGGVLYTLNYLNKSNWSGDGVSNKYYADFKIFNTSLSAEDILLEYNRKASIDKTGKLFAPYIKEHETTGNIGELANYYIETQHAFDGRFGSISEAYYNANYPNGEPGLGTYKQGNLVVTMTNQGIRIYSEPNRDGRDQEGSEWNTWGGFCWSPMKQFRCLFKGHHYRISWHVKGQSSRAMTDVYWSNQIGWGQYPDAGPTVHKVVTHPANFNGEMDCFYDFTIEDDIFKTTTSDVHSGFEPNTSYLAYSAFKIGYTYDFTGPLGTDIYITNLQLHDLTTGDVYKIEKNGIVKTTEAVSGRRDSARLHSDGVINVTDIIEY